MRSVGTSQFVLGIVAVCALAGAAFAETPPLEGNALWIEVCDADSGLCVGIYPVPQDQLQYNQTSNIYRWQLGQSTVITASDGTNVGSLLSAADDVHGEGSFVEFAPPVAGLRANPTINLGFALQAGAMNTLVTIKSALLTFPTIAHPEAMASMGVTVNDDDEMDGGMLTGQNPLGGAYLAQYNGFVPGGVSFTELVTSPVTVTSGGMTTTSGQYPMSGMQTIPVAVSNMSAQVHFLLTANDTASGTSTYTISPEPTSALLALLGFGLFRRR